ncbi:hypothetical protein [Nocardia grenadensis]|nr:hypothetical protein [Nocardia grenadensis]
MTRSRRHASAIATLVERTSRFIAYELGPAESTDTAARPRSMLNT